MVTVHLQNSAYIDVGAKEMRRNVESALKEGLGGSSSYIIHYPTHISVTGHSLSLVLVIPLRPTMETMWMDYDHRCSLT
jgi:hypothetical protein